MKSHLGLKPSQTKIILETMPVNEEILSWDSSHPGSGQSFSANGYVLLGKSGNHIWSKNYPVRSW